MAKKRIAYVGLLPSQRAVRFFKIDTRIMLKMSERASKAVKFDPAEKTEDGKLSSEVMQAMAREMGKQQIALTLDAITLKRVELKTKKRAATETEIAAGSPAVVEEPDIDATLEPLRDNPTDPRWTKLSEECLTNEQDELCMLDLLSDPRDWTAIQKLMSAADGGAASDPFAGKVLATSAG